VDCGNELAPPAAGDVSTIFSSDPFSFSATDVSEADDVEDAEGSDDEADAVEGVEGSDDIESIPSSSAMSESETSLSIAAQGFTMTASGNDPNSKGSGLISSIGGKTSIV
jgi:hypothetical protein